MVSNMSASAAEIHVMSGGAPQEVFARLTPKFEQLAGHKVKFTYAVIAALRDKVAAGEKADVLVMPVPVLDEYESEGKVHTGGRATFGAVGARVIVQQGFQQPDISSQERFRKVMLDANSVVCSTPGKTPTGTHMANVFEKLAIADAMAKKLIYKPALEGGVQLVANGDAEIGIYPASEVISVRGVTIVGPLPQGIDFNVAYGAAVIGDSAMLDAADAFVKFMAADENQGIWKEAGFRCPGKVKIRKP
jgi:molybdate transport system substrate-binding protein